MSWYSCNLARAGTSWLVACGAKCPPLPLHGPSLPLQVVYINTSLKTKALAHQQVPTITCTSSNVVQTVLTAFAQVGGS